MKKIISMILIISSIVGYIIPTGYAEENKAEVVFGTTVSKTNIYKVAMGDKVTIYNKEVAGRNGWLLDSTKEKASSRIDVNILNSYAYKTAAGSVFDIEVDYYGEGDGYFRVYYDALQKSEKVAHTEYFTDTGSWKTVKFTVDDAYFGGRIASSYDLRVAITANDNSGGALSKASVVIGAIRIYQSINHVYVTASTDEVGNVFEWYSDNKIINNTIKNCSGGDLKLRAEFYAESEDGDFELFHKTKEFECAQGQEINISTDFSDKQHCGLYNYYVKITDGNFVVKKQLTKFAVVKTDPDGIKNDSVYYCTAVNKNEQTTKDGLELISKSNAGGVRVSVEWWAAESAQGKYNLEYNGKNVQAILDNIKSYNLKFLPNIWSMSFAYSNAHNILPYTEKQVTAWRNFIAWFADKTKGLVDEFEIWNETNHPSYNVNIDNENGSISAYINNVLKPAYEEIKSVNPQNKVAALAMAGIGGDSETYMDNALASGVNSYTDAISLHPYSTKSVEAGSTIKSLERYNNKIQSKDIGELWNTEMGYSLAEIPDVKQNADYTTRLFLQYAARNLAEKNMLYCFERLGNINTSKESSFGIVGSLDAEADQFEVPLLPMRGYVTMTAMNYMTADSVGMGANQYLYGVNVLKFKSNKFNKNIICAYTTGANAGVELGLGCDSAVMYDEFGNGTVVYGNNGVYSFKLDSAPTYIMGDFDIENVVVRAKKTYYESIDVKVYDGTGKNVNALSELTSNSTYVETVGDDLEAYTLFYCLYQGDRLVKTIIKETNIGEKVFDVSFEEDIDFDKVKIMVLNSTKTLKPLCEARIIE